VHAPVGMIVPPIVATYLLTGSTETVSYSRYSQATVVYVFSPTCSWCARNQANLAALVKASGQRFHFIGLSLDDHGAAEYAAKTRMGFPVYTGVSAEFATAVHLGGTPQTIVISPSGEVIANWIGSWSGAQQHEIEVFFKTKVPGLSAVSPRS
jgi:hypothetical protein